MNHSVSVIVPTLNESANIAETIRTTRAAGDCEIIIVDGGSTDDTLEQADAADQVLSTAKGRARQQNMGAIAATCDLLVFLHADCQLEHGFTTVVAEVLQRRDVIAGCFRQVIENPARKYRSIERGNAWRVRRLGWIYGDQGLFIRKQDFMQLGQFPDLPLMEDLYFSKQLKKNGTVVVADHPLRVSARRWEKNGTVRQTLRNWAFIAMTHLGVSPHQLASWYSDVREADLTED